MRGNEVGDDAQHPPVIIIRRKKGGHAPHGGAWKVAYADFVTAMMALFIVLWLMASNQEVQKAVGGYFRDPSGKGKLEGTAQAGAGEALSVGKEDMAKLKDKLEAAMRELPKFEEMKSNITVTVTNEGLRVELLENEGGLFFESGSAELSAHGSEMMRLLAAEVRQLPNKLLIEGHTDAKPYTKPGAYSNWELSADRANTARRILLSAGVEESQVAQIRGFAAQHLRNEADPMDPRNRRVSLIIRYRNPAPADSVTRQIPAKGTGHS